MNDELARRYARLLRWYPKPWRDINGPALLGTLMDAADHEGRTTPARGDAWSFVRAGIDARLDRVVMRSVRDATSTVALTMGSGAAIVVFIICSWAPWGVQNVSEWPPGSYTTFGPFYDMAPLLTLLWLIALIAALVDRWAIGRAALLLSIPLAATLPWLAALPKPLVPPVDWPTLFYSAICALLAALGTPRTKLPLLAATGGWALITWTCFAYERPVGTLFEQPTAALWNRLVWPWHATAVVIAIATLLALVRLWTASFTLLLATVPMIAAFDLTAAAGYFQQNNNPWILTAPVLIGLAGLLLASSGHLRLPTRHQSDPVA